MIKTLNPIGIEILNVDMEGESENPTQIRLIMIPFVIILPKGSPFVWIQECKVSSRMNISQAFANAAGASQLRSSSHLQQLSLFS